MGSTYKFECPKCGKENVNNAGFCVHCGNDMRDMMSEPESLSDAQTMGRNENMPAEDGGDNSEVSGEIAEEYVQSIGDMQTLDEAPAPGGGGASLGDLQTIGRKSVEHEVGERFAVLQSEGTPRYYEMLRSWFFLGRRGNCEVPVDAPGVSSLHLTVARFGGGLLLIDHESTYGTIYNGTRIRQRFVEPGDVYRIGDAWLVFKLEPGQAFRQVDQSWRGSIRMDGGSIPPARFHSDKGSDTRRAADEKSALIELAATAGCYTTSDSRPILIGNDSSCDLRLSGRGMARFHAIVSWDAEIDGPGRMRKAGVFIEDLHSGWGTKHNGRPVRRAELANGDILEVGGHRVSISFAGNVENRAEALAAVTPEGGKLAMTCVEGPVEGLSELLDSGQKKILLGRDKSADIVFTCDEISGQHARITTEMTDVGNDNYRPAFFIEDLNSTNGTSVNRHRLEEGEKHKLVPGDIIRFGRCEAHCDLLVYYVK